MPHTPALGPFKYCRWCGAVPQDFGQPGNWEEYCDSFARISASTFRLSGAALRDLDRMSYSRRPSVRMNVKSYSSSRAARIAQARKRQRALIRAGRRALPVSRYRNFRTGGFLGQELKFLDCAWNGVAVASSTDGSGGEMQPSTGCTQCISVPVQGDGEQERDGRTYIIKSVWVSGQVDYSTLAGQATFGEIGDMFFALVLDTQANGATVTSQNVFLNPSTNAIAMLPQPLRNLQYSKRFRILATRVVKAPMLQVGQDAATTMVVAPAKRPNVSLGWKGNIKVDTSGTTASVANATDNAIHLIAYAANTSHTPIFVGKSRMRFVG